MAMPQVRRKDIIMRTITAVAVLLLLLLLCSCTRTIYQDREVVRHDSIFVTALAIDTIIQRDSIHTYERGDTVTTTVYKYIYKVRERTDTCYMERTDTISVTNTVEVEKVKKVTDWKMCLYSLIVGAVIGFLVLVIVRSKYS